MLRVTRSPLARDVALLGAVVVGVAVEVAVRRDLADPLVPALVTLAAAPALLVRRSRPLLALLATLGAGLLLETLAAAGVLSRPATLHTAAFGLVLVYALGRWGSGREVVAGVAAVAADIAVTTLSGGTSGGDAVGGLAVVTAAVSIGVARRAAVRGRDRDLERIRSAEREALARDLHDVVAHRVTAIAIRAQAGIAASAGTGGVAVDALHDVEDEASAALAEMRSVVRALRTDDGDPARLPAPTLDDLYRLERGDRTPRVEVVVDPALRDLGAPAAAALLRVAQEAVTNARRHARGATRVAVEVTAEGDGVRLRVVDDGSGAVPGRPGYGLTGMRERVALLGGRCEAGPTSGGGWAVTAVLPRTARDGRPVR